MTVVYYTQTYYLDAVLELIPSLHAIADVHLLIELSPESRKTTIVDIPDLDQFSTIETAKNVFGPEKWKLMASYMNRLTSVHFVVFHAKRGFSLSSIRVCRSIIKILKKVKPDVVHLDTVSVRSLGLLPYLFKKKYVITVHDPVSHSGEHSWKSETVRRLFYWKANNLLFYSSFASTQFHFHYPRIRTPHFLLKFQPFGYSRQLDNTTPYSDDYILFFGRLSLYKGIDLLFDAIPEVLKRFPYERFVIAGRSENYTLDTTMLDHYDGSIEVLNKYIDSEELAKLIKRSKFIVCPYRDATQSGVLMTAFAFGKTVVATNVGAFSEYIDDGVNGLLAAPSAEDIALKIISALSACNYHKLEKNVHFHFSSTIDKYNQRVLGQTYC
jgi:glycosyltransferase involved in cell wall biosynthesis